MFGGKVRLWTPDFVLILAVALFSYTVCQGLNNGTPIYVTGLGGTVAFSGGLILEFSLFAALSRIVTGRVIDAGTRKSAMVAGALAMLAGCAGALVAPGIAAQVPLRALQGIGFGAVTTAASTAAADVLPKERLGEGIGYYGLGQSLGMAIGPTFAVVLTSMAFSESLFVGVSAVAAAAVLLTCACTYEAHPERLPATSAAAGRTARGSADEQGSARTHAPERAAAFPGERKASVLSALFVKTALPGAIPMVVICLGYSIIVNFTSLYGTQEGIPNPGFFFVLAAVTMTAVRLGGGALLDSVAASRLLALPVASGIVALVMLANPVNEWVFYLAGAFFGVSMGLAFPLLNSVCVKNTAPERWGGASALFFLMNDVGIGVGALVWGAVADVTGFVPVMYCGIAMLAAAYVLALLVIPKGI